MEELKERNSYPDLFCYAKQLALELKSCVDQWKLLRKQESSQKPCSWRTAYHYKTFNKASKEARFPKKWIITAPLLHNI